MRLSTLSGIFALLWTATGALHGQVSKLSVDENEFLKKAFDFSPPEERALDEEWLKPPKDVPPFAKAKVVTKNGVTDIVVNEVRVPSWSRSVSAAYTPSSPVERQFRQLGMRLFIIDVGLTVNRYEERLLDNAPDEVYEQFRQSADNLLAEVPDAIIIIRPWLISVSHDFAKSYPKGLLAGPDGTTDWGGEKVGGHTTRPNMLNEWRRYCGEHLHRFVHRLGESPYASKIAGFYLAAMNSGEWWYYKGEGDPGWDYSESRKLAFERYVRHKYGDNAAIAKAWGVENDDKLLELPSLEERGRLPVKPNSKTGDYMQVLNMPVTNAASYFAKIIKAATGGRSLVGMEIHMAGITYPVNGTVLMNHLLDTPEIDFFGGPSNYGDRKAGATPLYRVASASLSKHGKLWLNEGDYRTPLAYDTASGAQGEPPPDMEGMKHVFRREFARGAVKNYSTYLMDFGWAWFLDPSISEYVGELLKADAILAATGITRNAEIAVVTDQESQFYGNYFASPTMLMLEKSLDKIGVGSDFYELRDFIEGDLHKRYKMVIFMNICALSDGERERINTMKRDGRHLVWMHRPGTTDLSQRNRRPETLASELTGIKLRVGYPSDKFKLAESDSTAGGSLPASPATKAEGVPRTRLNIEVSLSDGAVGQLIGNHPSNLFSNDPDAQPLIIDNGGRAYMAIKRQSDWTSIYTAFCEIEPWLLRRLAKGAGCHVWVDSDDVSYIAGNVIALHTSTAGEKVIHLPEGRTELYEIFTRKKFTGTDGIVKINANKGETFLFLAGTVDQAEVAKAVDALDKSNREFIAEYPSKPMAMDFQRRYAPTAPTQGGDIPLIRWGHSSQPEVILAAGPFASTSDTLARIDQELADMKTISNSRFRNISDRMGTTAAQFLYVENPLPLLENGQGLGEWSAWATTFPWNSSHRLGFVNDQTYAGAVLLNAKEEKKAFLHLYSRGETRLWVDGVEVKANSLGHFHHPMVLGPRKQTVAFRIRGSEEPTGFAIRLTTVEDGKSVSAVPIPDFEATIPLPESVTQWVPPQPDSAD